MAVLDAGGAGLGRRVTVAVLAGLLLGGCSGGGAVLAPEPAPSGATAPATAPATASAESDGDLPGSCGRERWAVKTAADPGAAAIEGTRIVDTDIRALIAIPPPSNEVLSLEGVHRLGAVESTVYRLHATLLRFRRETDSDYHLVIGDGAGRTMIVEVPLPSCVPAASPFLAGMRAVRAAVDAHFGGAERQLTFRDVNAPVTVTGIGFFDFLHGQSGVAPNGIELHPLLSIDWS